MDEQDKRIRQKVSELDTPPPGTNWRPERSWKRVQEQVQTEKAVQRQQMPWYSYVAAAFVILVVPFSVMLSDIRKQQARIDQLAAQLKSTQSIATQPAVVQPVDEALSLPAPAPVEVYASAKEEIAAKRAPKTQVGRAKEVVSQTQKLAAPPDADSAAVLVARVPESSVANPAGEASSEEKTVRAETPAARLLQVVSTGPKRKATSVTFVFEGTGPDTVREVEGAAQTALSNKSPKKRFLRAFGGSKREEVLSGQPQAPNNILTVLTKNQ